MEAPLQLDLLDHYHTTAGASTSAADCSATCIFRDTGETTVCDWTVGWINSDYLLIHSGDVPSKKFSSEEDFLLRHCNMNETNQGGAALISSIGLAFVGGYADASSYLLARTFTGHLTGNCVLAAVSAASKDWYLALNRLMAVVVFLGGVLFSLILTRFAPVRLRQSSLAIAMFIEVLLFLSASLFLPAERNQELFIVCMCLALGIKTVLSIKQTGSVSTPPT
jgi:hypothetical protein